MLIMIIIISSSSSSGSITITSIIVSSSSSSIFIVCITDRAHPAPDADAEVLQKASASPGIPRQVLNRIIIVIAIVTNHINDNDNNDDM